MHPIHHKTQGEATMKPGGFSSRLAFAFALVAAFTAILGGMLSFVVWDYQFSRYVRANLQGIADGIGSAAANAYTNYYGWNFNTFAVIPQVGSRTDVAVQILDSNGNIVYDEASMRAHAYQMIQGTQQGAGLEVISRPTGEVMTSKILIGSTQVGTVRVWAYGSNALLTDQDLALRSASLAALAVAAIVAIIFASVAGAIYSRRLVRPINCITATVRALREGNENARTGLSGDDEILQLGQTFDEMADAIEAERVLERRLTSDVAHELRTPLMGIQATVECIEDGIYPADAEHLGTIQSETRRLTRLTNAILELSRLENGSLPFVMVPIDATIPVRCALDAHMALIESSELTLKTELVAGLTVIGDSDRLQQAVGNLLSNAARYTPEGGEISVRTSKRGDMAVIEIEDNGIGISPENLENMFRRFWRADAARARESGGVGVGLAIAKEIIERHKGRIDVSSTEDVGTTFTISIPLGTVTGR